MKVTCWGALIYGICPFVDGTRAARRRAKGAPNLTNSTSDCAVLMATAWRTKRSGTAFSRFVLPRACQPFVARNELAIATKSIASVLPHAERTPWVPSNEVQRGHGDMGATRKTTRPVDEL